MPPPHVIGVMMQNIIIKILFFLAVIVCVILCFAGEKQTANLKVTMRSANYDYIVIDTGMLQNYVSNSTIQTSSYYDNQTFLVGRADLKYPSMAWRQGG